MTVELLTIIAMWCEQTNYNVGDLHQCRLQLLSCITQSEKKYPRTDPFECFAQIKKPRADAS